MVQRFFVAASLALLVAGCTLAGPPHPIPSVRPSEPAALRAAAAPVDCGMSDLRPPATYPASGMDCVWNAYSTRTPVRWSLTQYTTEGAPVPTTIVFDGVAAVVTRDLSLDGFSSAPDRRIWMWRCGKIAQRPWVTDPQRYAFDLNDCTGDGPTANLP